MGAMGRQAEGARLAVAVAAVGFTVAAVLIVAGRPGLQGAPAVLLSAFPQPAYYPKPFVTAHGSMLAGDPDEDTPDEAEDEAEGRELSDLEVQVDDETRKNFPFPDYARPVHAAKVDAFGRILQNGNCAINNWDTHNLWPHPREPELGDADYYATLHGDKQKLLGTTYNFPQNADCLSAPKGTPPSAIDYRANNWGYKCFSNGKCSLFTMGKAEEGKYDEQLDDGIPVDGVARDNGFWEEQPEHTVRGRR
jgi:hypothetical protein